METIEGVRLVKENLPYVKTVLGISNISFGLPAAAREVVNSVFLYYCTKAGLDLAIVNAEKLERFASIPEEERRLAENLLFNSPPVDAADEALRTAPEDWREQTPEQKAAINQWHIAAITEHFRKAGQARQGSGAEDLPLDQRLANYIIEGTKDGLIADLDRKRAEGAAPLDIINGPLMAGMSEVGRLFNNNELIVAEVLQSAEAMKAAVSHLEQFMEKAETAARGKVILATVKGDVHDIGKNLVEIILANNGYQVINLGIKVPPEALIRAYQEHQPDAIGLSGLLVKSTQQMVITAGDLKAAGIAVPLLVGGAALSEKFTRTQDRAGLWRGRVLRQGRHDGPEPDEPPHGPGGARGGAGEPSAPSEPPPAPRRRVPAARRRRHRAQRQGAHRYSHSRRRPIWTARCATCRTWPRCGATSIRSCSTAGTWATRAISKRRWPSTRPRRWSCSTTWKR